MWFSLSTNKHWIGPCSMNIKKNCLVSWFVCLVWFVLFLQLAFVSFSVSIHHRHDNWKLFRFYFPLGSRGRRSWYRYSRFYSLQDFRNPHFRLSDVKTRILTIRISTFYDCSLFLYVLCSSKWGNLSPKWFLFSAEDEENKKQSQNSSADAPLCKDLEKQALEIELQKQERQKQDDVKKTWMKWLKNPDFYKVRALALCFEYQRRESLHEIKSGHFQRWTKPENKLRGSAQ